MSDFSALLPAPAADRPAGLRIRGPETWAAARDAYLAGAAAPEVCERHGLGLSAFRARASKEGWRRVDQTDGPIDDGAPDDMDETPADATELAAIAWREATRAIRGGRLQGARGWTRLAADLRAQAAAEAQAAEDARKQAAEKAKCGAYQAAHEAYVAAARADGISRPDAGLAFVQAQIRGEHLPVYRSAEPDDLDDTVSPEVSPEACSVTGEDRRIEGGGGSETPMPLAGTSLPRSAAPSPANVPLGAADDRAEGREKAVGSADGRAEGRETPMVDDLDELDGISPMLATPAPPPSESARLAEARADYRARRALL